MDYIAVLTAHCISKLYDRTLWVAELSLLLSDDDERSGYFNSSIVVFKRLQSQSRFHFLFRNIFCVLRQVLFELVEQRSIAYL